MRAAQAAAAKADHWSKTTQLRADTQAILAPRFAAARTQLEAEESAGGWQDSDSRIAHVRKHKEDGSVVLEQRGSFTSEMIKDQMTKVQMALEGTASFTAADAFVYSEKDFAPGFQSSHRESARQLFESKIDAAELDLLITCMYRVNHTDFAHQLGVNEYTDYHLGHVEPKLVQTLEPQQDHVPECTWLSRSELDNEVIFNEVMADIEKNVLVDKGPLENMEVKPMGIANVFVITKTKSDGSLKHRMVFADIYSNLFCLRGLPCHIDKIRTVLDGVPVGAKIGVVDAKSCFHMFKLSKNTSSAVNFMFYHKGKKAWHVAEAQAMLFGEAYGPAVAQHLSGSMAQLLRTYGIHASAVIDDLGAVAGQSYLDHWPGNPQAAHNNVAFLLLALPACLGQTDSADKCCAQPREEAMFRGLHIDYKMRRLRVTSLKLERTIEKTKTVIRRGDRMHLGYCEKWLGTLASMEYAIVGLHYYTASFKEGLSKTMLANWEGRAKPRTVTTRGVPEFTPTGETSRVREARSKWMMVITTEMKEDAREILALLQSELQRGATGKYFPEEKHVRIDLERNELREIPRMYMDTDASMCGWGGIVYPMGTEPVRVLKVPAVRRLGELPSRAQDIEGAMQVAGDVRALVSSEELKTLIIRQAEAATVLKVLLKVEERTLEDAAFARTIAGSRITSGQDNMNWLYLFLKGGGKHKFMRTTAKKVKDVLRRMGVEAFDMSYVKSKWNPSDDLTRPPRWGEASLEREYFDKLHGWARGQSGGKDFTIDACATESTAKVESYVPRYAEGTVSVQEANIFRQDLSKHYTYVFPPPAILAAVKRHVESCGGAFVLLYYVRDGKVAAGPALDQQREMRTWRASRRADQIWQVASPEQRCLQVPSPSQGRWTKETPQRGYAIEAAYTAATR